MRPWLSCNSFTGALMIRRSRPSLFAAVVMSLLVVLGSACSPLTPAAAPTPAPVTVPSLVLINGVLIDGTGADPIRDAAIIIQGERLVAVGPRGSISIPEGAPIIDVQGAAFLPGFFNAHVHGAYDAEKLAAWAKEGVTTVRDLGAYQWPPSRTLLDRIEKDKRYARLISGGIFITPPGGYPIAVFGGNGKTISTTEAAPQAVSELLDQGADVIKISLESGQIFGRRIPLLTTGQVKAIVATAHQSGTRVSAHVTVSRDLKRAIAEGVDDVAHMIVDPIDDDLIKAMIEQDLYWVPTIELWKNVGQGQDANVIDNLKRYVAAGGKVALGTDFEGYYTPFQLGMPTKEIAWLSEAGLTPMQIIVAATRNAAHVSNVENDLTLTMTSRPGGNLSGRENVFSVQSKETGDASCRNDSRSDCSSRLRSCCWPRASPVVPSPHRRLPALRPRQRQPWCRPIHCRRRVLPHPKHPRQSSAGYGTTSAPSAVTAAR